VEEAGGGGKIKGRIHNDLAVLAQAKAVLGRNRADLRGTPLTEEDVAQIGQVRYTVCSGMQRAVRFR
jgi:hypothetical protein